MNERIVVDSGRVSSSTVEVGRKASAGYEPEHFPSHPRKHTFMKRIRYIASLAVLGLLIFDPSPWGSELRAQETLRVAPKGPIAVSGVKDPISYSLGFQVGSDMAEVGMTPADFDANEVVAGFVDALAKKGKLNDEQLQAAFMELKDRINRKVLELGKRNLERANQFLKMNKEKDGVQTTKSGLQYVVLRTGSGKSPGLASIVKVHYEGTLLNEEGTLLNGKVFDSSIKRNEPAEFPVQRVIAGWTEALQRMKVGDKWRLYIPPALAYGEPGFPPNIGPNELLTFELELLDVK
jgi:FKBP-type peptidyl-prolyl cis-trans isomerase